MSYSSEVLADSPVVYYRQGDASGTTMADSSGSSRDATYVGSVTLGVAGALVGDSDTAVNYSGGAQYATAGSAAQTALKAISGAFTLEAWVRVSTTSGNRAILDRYGSGGSTESVFLWYIVSGKPTFIIRNASNADVTLGATTNVTTGVWTHLVATYDGTSMRVYKDGVLDCTPLAATFSSHNRTPVLNIARFVFSGATYAGDLDEVAVYPSALSPTRVAAHYAAGLGTTGASGTGSLSLSGSGGAAATGAGSGSLTLSGSGAAAAPVAGSGSLSLSASGTLTPPSPAAGTGSLSLSASGGASASPSGTASLDLVATGTALAILAASGTATLTLSASGSAVMSSGGSATLILSAGGVAVALYTTDTTNARHGRRRLASATVTITRPVVAPPATVTFGPKVDKAVAYPVPTMVGGRPT